MPHAITALLVDDEPHVRVYLKMVLRQLGVTTLWEASHGDEAITLIDMHHPDVVFLDLVMPGRSGVSVMEEITQRFPELPVIVVTSQVASKTVQELHDLGAVGYVLKHTPREQMIKMIDEILDSLVEEEAPEASGEAGSSA